MLKALLNYRNIVSGSYHSLNQLIGLFLKYL